MFFSLPGVRLGDTAAGLARLGFLGGATVVIIPPLETAALLAKRRALVLQFFKENGKVGLMFPVNELITGHLQFVHLWIHLPKAHPDVSKQRQNLLNSICEGV